jgi:hypothetical protein
MRSSPMIEREKHLNTITFLNIRSPITRSTTNSRNVVYSPTKYTEYVVVVIFLHICFKLLSKYTARVPSGMKLRIINDAKNLVRGKRRSVSDGRISHYQRCTPLCLLEWKLVLHCDKSNVNQTSSLLFRRALASPLLSCLEETWAF